MTEVSIPVVILKSDEKDIAKLWLDPPYNGILRAFAIENKIRPGTKLRAIFMLWEDNCSVQAFNLFHALRDRLAEAQGDTSKEYKDHLKDCPKLDFGGTANKEIAPGVYKLKSTTRYTIKEMNQLIDGTITRCLEEEIAIPDYLQEFQDLKKEQERLRNAKDKTQKDGSGEVGV